MRVLLTWAIFSPFRRYSFFLAHIRGLGSWGSKVKRASMPAARSSSANTGRSSNAT